MRGRGMFTRAVGGLALAICAAAARAQAPPPPAGNEVAALRAEVEHLRSIAQGQSLAMMQVAYNFNMLWFAGRAKNWPLAQFYYGDARGRLRLALRIQPVRRISSGDLALQPLLDGLEKGAWAKLGEALAAKDGRQFEAAYRAALVACEGCHAAAEKPYLRLKVPRVPAEPMVDFAAH
jgi:cytochrome c553